MYSNIMDRRAHEAQQKIGQHRQEPVARRQEESGQQNEEKLQRKGAVGHGDGDLRADGDQRAEQGA